MSTPQDPWGRPSPPPPGPPPPGPPQSGPPPERSPWSRQGAGPDGQQPPPYGQPAPGQPPYDQPPDQAPGQAPYGQAPGQAPHGQFSYPGQQPYPAQPPGRPPARTSRTVVLLLVGLVVAVVVLGGVVGSVVLRGDPRETAEEFMAALRSKDVAKAHSLLCDDGKEKVSTEQLRGNFDLDTRSITGYVLGPERTRERDGNTETLVPVTIDYDQGEQLRLDLGVWNDGGQKVCSLNPPDAD